VNQPDFEIRLLTIAEDDFLEIVTYIANERPSSADVIATKIEKSLQRLSKNPYLGRIANDNDLAEMGYRFIVVENYLIFYTIESKSVLIHRILHGARDYLGLL